METLEQLKFPNDGAPPSGFTAPGKSLINEVERLREAVLMLCELQKDLAAKLDGALKVRIEYGNETKI